MLPILVSILIFVISVVLAWLAGPLLGLAGTALLVLRILLILLGAAAAGIILFFHFRDKQRDAATKNLVGGTDLDTLLRDAEKHLATAQRGGARTLDTLPLLYILGDANGAKTTVVLKSGFDPELLAGQVYRDQDVVPTPVVNIWFAHESVFVEVGDAVRKAPALWHKLIRRTRPKASRSAMGKRAPVRAAVVCVSCEQFLGVTAPDAVVAAARSTNKMLRDLALQLGTEIPVYVLLTKLDRMPHFNEYVRNLTTDEASQPLGMAFPRNTASSGLYAEKAMAEVTGALDRVLFSLGEYRLELLNRENNQANVDPVYEFPREMRKLRNNLASYLVELARPSHLNANPYLRGFYCTGVRAHMVEQMVAAAAQQPKVDPVDTGATRMFTAASMKAMTGPAQPQTQTRKQAQWCFLPRIFPNVILEDRSALAGTSNSQRTHTFRRIVLGTVSVLLLAFLVCLTISWSNNSAIEHSVLTAAAALPTYNVPATSLASQQSLQSLDQLRAVLVQLEYYQKNGAPFSYRWGLYHGDSVLEAARRIYFDRFRRQLLNNTQANLVAYLNGLKDKPDPTDEFKTTYDPLKAYLITTSYNNKSTVDFLAPVLTNYWLNGKTPDSDEQKNLAYRQFEYYAGELPEYSPYTINPNPGAVDKAQTFLHGFTGIDSIYQQLISAANKASNGPIDFNRLHPEAASTVIEGHVVAGAFSRKGYDFMQKAIQHPGDFGEDWVVGKGSVLPVDPSTLSKQLSDRYTSDFENEWRAYLHSAQVRGYSSWSDANTKLQTLSSSSSPLLYLFQIASQNTAVANNDIKTLFQPVQKVVLPDPNLINPVGQGNKTYVDNLVTLQGAVQQVAQSPNPNDPANQTPAGTAAVQAHTAASQVAEDFNPDPGHVDANQHVDNMTRNLLNEPIAGVDILIRGGAQQQPNGPGKALCAALSPMLNKFPFSPNATAEVTPGELSGILQPGSGMLWQDLNGPWKTLIVQTGSYYSAAPGKNVNPDFVRFFNKMAQLSAVLYPPSGTPGLTFTVRLLHSPGIQRLAFAMDGQQFGGLDVSNGFKWSLSSAQMVQLTTNSDTLPFAGPWDIFHFVDHGKVEQPAPVLRLAYPVQQAGIQLMDHGVPIIARVELSGPNVELLAPGGITGLHCVATVVH